MLFPLWLVLAASALYLVPGLGGDWMLDPVTGDITFVYFAGSVLAFRGGFIGALVLAMGTPLIGLGFFIATGASAWGRRRHGIQATAFGVAAGKVEIDVPLVVTKRGTSGRTANAIPITLGDCSPLRRLLARGFDNGLLLATVLGAALFGALIDTAGVGYDGLTLRTPLGFAVAAGVSLFLVQWFGVWDRGQTLGKMLFDVRLAARDDPGRPSILRGVALRHVLFETGDALLALPLAWATAELGARWVADSPASAWFILWVLREALWFVLWPLWVSALQCLRSLPLLFGRPRTLHDVVSGTRVVRTALGERSNEDAHLGIRLLARGVDLSMVLGFAGLPLIADLARRGSGEMDRISVMAIGVALVFALMVLSVQWIQLLKRGDTPGKRLFGLKLTSVDGELNLVNAVVVREWLALGGLAVALPLIGPLCDGALALADDRRAIHDHLAGTRVVWTG